MKKALKIICVCCVALAVIVGICLSLPSKTLDFRGEVTSIETAGDGTVFHISLSGSSFEATYNVTADSKTKVRYCHKDDGDISLEEIEVGDVIEGDYRAFSKEKTAKFITVQYSK
jgi:hypothetical protein